MLSWSIFNAIYVALISYYYPEMAVTPTDSTDRMFASYDFIIVGAGSAGSVLARRLSEVPSWKILLLESGGDETILSKTPAFHTTLRNNAQDWNYTTVRQTRACLDTGGFCSYPRGHMMGGCSSNNGMVYVRGNKQDFDEWEADGAAGWSYQQVLPYFLKSENNRISSINGPYHKRGGLLGIQYSNYNHPLYSDLIKAGEESGLPNIDYNGEKQIGISRTQATLDNAMRASTSTAFLNNWTKPNLHIVKNARVTKILINPVSRAATGVTFSLRGSIKRILASKEIILSAGAINTPQLLMLSGVGPKEHLDKYKIPVIADLPVGNNLQDHVLIGIPFILDNYTNVNPDTLLSSENALNFARNKSGRYTSNGLSMVAFFNSSNNFKSITQEPPDVQLHLIENLRIPKESNVLMILTTVLKPKSVGTVRLNDSDIYGAPLIDPRYLENDDDLSSAIAGLNFTINLMKSNKLLNYSPKIYDKYISKCVTKEFSKYNLTCIAEVYSQTIYHPVGTCKMGRVESKSTVIDPQLRVKGIKNLRVVDASVMPSVPRANTNAATIMIAEKAADIIKSTYRSRFKNIKLPFNFKVSLP